MSRCVYAHIPCRCTFLGADKRCAHMCMEACVNVCVDAVVRSSSGALTGALTTPLDVIKTRLMVQVGRWTPFSLFEYFRLA